MVFTLKGSGYMMNAEPQSIVVGKKKIYQMLLLSFQMKLLHWISFIVSFWIDLALGKCECGEGGLCRVYHPDIYKSVGAVPCSCEKVSKGIFLSAEKHCNQLVDYCSSKPCGMRWRACINGLGSFYCHCAVGWEGHKCNSKITTGTERVFLIWYGVPLKDDEVVIGANEITDRAQLKIEFSSKRAIFLRIVEHCKRVLYYTLKDKYGLDKYRARAWTVLQKFTRILRVTYGDLPRYYTCPIQSVMTSEQFVYIQDVPGPVGQYDDIKFTVIENGTIHFDGVFRVFANSIDLLRNCPFLLEFSGCDKTVKTASQYTLSDRITLSVSTVFADDSAECKIKERAYSWAVSGLQSSGAPKPIGQRNQSHITFHPLSDFPRFGHTTIHVVVTFKDAVSSFSDTTVKGICYINLVRSSLVVSIDRGNRRVKCGVPVVVVLESVIVKSSVPRNELTYQWLCPIDLCRSTLLNDRNVVIKANVTCETKFDIDLRVFHSKTNSEAHHSGLLEFVQEPYNIYLSCKPDCENANSVTPLTLIAEEEPNSGSVFSWMSPSGDWFETTCESVSPSNVALIKTNTLLPGDVIVFEIATPYRSLNFTVKGALAPSHLTCQITPEAGVAYVDKFNISCSAESDFAPLTFWILEGPNRDVNMISTSGKIYGLVLTSTPVMVNVSDITGASSSTLVDVVLDHPSDYETHRILHDIPSQIDQLYLLLHEKAYMKIVHIINSLSKLTRFQFPFYWKHRLMELLLWVEHCDWAECILKRANAIKRLMSVEVQSKHGVDNFILKAAGTLYGLTKSLKKLTLEKEISTAYDLLPILTSIYDAVLQCMNFVDPILFHQFIGEDERQVHFRKVQEGNTYARLAITELGFFIASHVPAPSSILELKNSESEGSRTHTTIISHTLEYINCVLALNRSHPYTQLNIDKLKHLKLPGIHPAVAITHFDKNNFWWYNREGTKAGDQMFEVHLYKKTDVLGWTYESITGPVRTYMRHSHDMHKTITGEPPGNGTDLVRIHRMYVPRGHGALFLVFPTSLMNLINISINQDRSVLVLKNMNATLSTTRILHKYYLGENHNLYIGVSPVRNLSSYSFNYSIVRCVTWSEDMWKSELCEMFDYTEDYLVCECRHLSLVNVETLAPDNSLVPENDIELLTDVSPMYYVLVMFCVLLCIFLGLVTLVCRLEKMGKNSKYAVFLSDNYPGDSCPYLVTVFTGGRFFSGTSAHVAIRLIGKRRFSKVHILTSDVKPYLSQGEDAWFILFTSKRLKNIRRVELWHDRCGTSHGWYCGKVVVWDLRSGRMYEFSVKSWINAFTLYERGETTFSVEPESTDGEQKRFFVFEYMEAFFRQGHNWASVFILQPRDRTNRLERAAILAVLILVTSVTSMLFYMSNGGIVDEPSVTYTASDFNVSLISATISTIVTFFLSIIFRFGKDRMRRNDWVMIGPMTLMDKIRVCFYRSVAYVPVATTDANASPKKFGLFILLFGYVVCGAIVFSCIVLTVHVGNGFTRNRSMTWFISFAVALFVEALILNPMAIVIIALGFAYCIRISPNQIFGVTLDAKANSYPFRKFRKRLYSSLEQRIKPMYKPPLWVDLVKTAEQRSRRRAISPFDALTTTLLFTFIFVFTLKDVVTYYRNWVLSEVFREGKPKESYLDSVLTRTRYFDHLRGTVLPSLHRLNWYNGRPLATERNEPNWTLNVSRPTRAYRGFCADYSSKLLGVPQMRQQRIELDRQRQTPALFKDKFYQALGYLTTQNEDTNVYLPKWRTPVTNEVYYRTSRHLTAKETGIGWFYGPTLLQYSGSGYVEHLHWSLGSSLSSLIDLELDGWLDNETRSVFLSFNMYNVHIDSIASVTIITECLPSGVYASRSIVDCMPVSTDRSRQLEIVSAISIAVILAFHVSRSTVLVSRDGPRKYFFSLSNLVNAVMVLSGIGFVVRFALRSFTVNDSLERSESLARNEFTSLFYMFEVNSTTLVFFGVFTLMVSVSAAVLTHRLFGFEGFERALASTWLLVMISFILLTTLTVYSVITLHLFGVVNLSHLFFINFLGDVIALEAEFLSSSDPNELNLSISFSTLVLLRLNGGIVVLIYFDAAERIRTKLETPIERLIVRIHRRVPKPRRRRVPSHPAFSHSSPHRSLSVHSRSHSFSVLTADSDHSLISNEP